MTIRAKILTTLAAMTATMLLVGAIGGVLLRHGRLPGSPPADDRIRVADRRSAAGALAELLG